MKRGLGWWMLAMLLSAGTGSAGAQGADPAAPATAEAAEVRRAEPVVVTATRTEEPLQQTGASVTVVP